MRDDVAADMIEEFLPKPFRRRALVSAVQHLLAVPP